MTAKQRREHKLGNAIRRACILHLAKNGDPRYRAYWANRHVGQEGKAYKEAKRIVLRQAA